MTRCQPEIRTYDHLPGDDLVFVGNTSPKELMESPPLKHNLNIFFPFAPGDDVATPQKIYFSKINFEKVGN